MTAMLSVEGLTVSYGALTAVRGIDFSVGEGELVSLIGPNGAGKSSTLAAIVGMVRARGAITFAGESISGLAMEKVVRRGLSLVPEGRKIFASLSVLENLQIGATTRRDRAGVAADLEGQLARFPALAQRLGDPAGLLSGGQQQQLAIGRAMMSRPRMLLLDEPSLGLSPQMVDSVLESVAELRDGGTTVLLVEQNAVRAMEMADRTYVMATGSVVREGTAASLAGANVAADYFGDES